MLSWLCCACCTNWKETVLKGDSLSVTVTNQPLLLLPLVPLFWMDIWSLMCFVLMEQYSGFLNKTCTVTRQASMLKGCVNVKLGSVSNLLYFVLYFVVRFSASSSLCARPFCESTRRNKRDLLPWSPNHWNRNLAFSPRLAEADSCWRSHTGSVFSRHNKCLNYPQSTAVSKMFSQDSHVVHLVGLRFCW